MSDLIHAVKLLLIPFLQTEHGNFKVFIDTIVSPVQKAFIFFTFPSKPFSVIVFSIGRNLFLPPLSYLQVASNY